MAWDELNELVAQVAEQMNSDPFDVAYKMEDHDVITESDAFEDAFIEVLHRRFNELCSDLDAHMMGDLVVLADEKEVRNEIVEETCKYFEKQRSD